MPYNICKSEPVFTTIKNAIIALDHLKVRLQDEWIPKSELYHIGVSKERYDLVESVLENLVESHKKLLMSRDYETSRPILLRIYESIDPFEDSWESAGESIYSLLEVLREILFPDKELSENE